MMLVMTKLSTKRKIVVSKVKETVKAICEDVSDLIIDHKGSKSSSEAMDSSLPPITSLILSQSQDLVPSMSQL